MYKYIPFEFLFDRNLPCVKSTLFYSTFYTAKAISQIKSISSK